MISEKSIYLLLTCLAITSAFSVSYVPQSRGRKLFGGYRIVPKVCQPTNPSRIKSDQPSICMFNYECSYRRGEVVGACTDGFLFGACCQLPSKQSEILDKGPSMDNPLNLHEIDHVPDIPILLNPDGTPVGITSHGDTSTTKIESPDRDNNVADANIKISTFRPLPSTSGQVPPSHYNDNKENAEKPQVPTQADFSHLDVDFPALLNQQGILNDLNLPALLIHSNSNDIQEHQDPSEINPVTTLLSPDQILQIADPVDQLPALFSQGLSQNNHASADTILLDENGTMLNETSNPDDLFKPNIEGPSFPSEEKIAENAQAVSPQPAHASTVMQQMESLNQKISSSTQKLPYPTLNKNTTTWFPVNTQSTSTDRITTFTTQRLHLMSDRTPADLERVSTAASAGITMNTGTTTSMSSTNGATDDLIRVPAIIYDSQSGNKKNDMLGHEEMSINHIISMLNDTTPNLESSVLPASNSGPPIHTWISVDETAKPPIVKLPTTKPTTSTATFPYTFHKPGQMSSFYNYETTEATESSSASHVVPSNFYSSRPTSTQGTYDSSSFSYSTRPSTNPPAPTVIVLGPLGTEYTKYAEMTQQSPTRRPVNAVQPNITNVPNMSATITHNISTVISTNSVETNSNHVVSTSYISVNLKDITSTKPVMNKDGTTTLAVVLDSEQTTTSKNDHVPPTSAVISCDDETPAPDDLINFPPVRNPNLNMSIPASQQEKPTIVETFNNTGYPDIELLSENEIPTPAFIEDDMLTNKVNVFVNKIVESLQGNFEDLKDVVYNKKNTSSTPSTLASTTKRPTTNAATTNTTRKPVRRPIQSSKPSQTTSKRPPTRLSTTTQRPVSGERPVRPAKPTILKPSPATSTKKPQTTTKRTKPPRKPTIPITSTEAVVDDTEEILSSSTTISPISHKPFPDQDFRKECGIRPLMKTGRIVGGKGAKFGQWPWQVLVREATWLGLFTKNKCGGVLITNKYVVTAAHCQPGFLASLVAVFGEFDISGELETKRSVTRNIRRVIVNRGYDPATFENDLALLELETPIQFDSHIVPICMPEDGADFTGRIATVTGWGRLKYNGGVPSVLQEVQVPIIENSVCQEMFQTAGHSKLILDSFLCAGYANGQKDSCEGDSGGPLTMEGPDGRWMLVGTVSHGIKCAAPYLPGVYMRTTYFKPWLHSITGI